MHWTVAGGDAIIALRCLTLSGRFEDFWERRAQHRLAAGTGGHAPVSTRIRATESGQIPGSHGFGTASA